MTYSTEVQSMQNGSRFVNVVLAEDERKKMLKQACDRSWPLLLKSFIPLYHFRYWNTRFKVGAVAWVFLFSMCSASIANRVEQIKCRPDELSCRQKKALLSQAYLGILFSANIVFGIYGGAKASQARRRMKITRDQAISIFKSTYGN